jgi:hypothetical protein
VGLAGAPPYPIFFLELDGFDVGPSYRGVDGKAMGHLLLSATALRHAPTVPCIGKVMGGFSISQRRIEWKQGGVDYAVSAHGYTSVNLALLRRLVAAMTLVAAAP